MSLFFLSTMGDRSNVRTKEERRTVMNDSEMRRRELLRQTRKLYNERQDIPAVHPRYGRIYHNLYGAGDDGAEQVKGSFYLRLVSGILCFICFVDMEQSKAEVAQVNSTTIVNQIEKTVDAETVKEVWKKL